METQHGVLLLLNTARHTSQPNQQLLSNFEIGFSVGFKDVMLSDTVGASMAS